jgi:ribosome maturation protein Sdo1
MMDSMKKLNIRFETMRIRVRIVVIWDGRAMVAP